MQASKKHPNSRIVTIFRKESFIGNAQLKGAPEFMSMSKKSIGSFWETSYSKTVGSGLDFAEQKLLLPTIVDCEATDRNFRAKVSEYYNSIKTSVPFDKGRSLEIGLESSNSEPLSEDNQPLNIADYLTYRHAIAHPLVGKTKQEAEGNMLIEFYVFDPQAQEDFEVEVSKNKDKALELYLKIKKEPQKVNMLLTLLNVDPRTFKGKNADSLKLDKLKSITESTPKIMIETYENKNFEGQYVIQTMINTAILKKVGERILNAETGVVIGNTMEEAVLWLKDPTNSESVVFLKARMQEAITGTGAATEKAI